MIHRLSAILIVSLPLAANRQWSLVHRSVTVAVHDLRQVIGERLAVSPAEPLRRPNSGTVETVHLPRKYWSVNNEYTVDGKILTAFWYKHLVL